MLFKLPDKTPGFTLAELLIALALLGIIAAFTIPKVLQSSAQHERLAKLRETVAILEEVTYGIKINNQFVAGSNLYAYLQPRLNTVASFPGATDLPSGPYAAIAHPCTSATGNHWFEPGWVQLHNGVVISGLNGPVYPVFPASSPNATTLCIDINGAASPNLPGQDVFIGNFDIWSDYDSGTNGDFTFRESGKLFNWGSSGQIIYADNPPGNVILPPLNVPEARVGYWLTQ